MSVPVTPVIPKDFTPEWAAFVLKEWFIKNDKDVEKIQISKVEAVLNGQQGLLSTTFIVDVHFQEGDGEEEKKSIFVKIPLIGEASKNFKQVNVREYEMLTNVLPKLQECLDENCEGFFCMGVPEVIYCYYSGDEVHDAFITENLVDSGFVTCTTKDLHVDNNGKDYLKSTLETLSQLHGTGLHFKKSLGGNKGILEQFPKIEEQIQIKDILKSQENKKFLRKHFCAFIRYLEETDPELKNITSYMKKMETYLFKILKILEDSGVRHLNTLCHGDAKPNNFMFRKIDIDFDDDDDEELKDLKCEGVESMLIDWQGGFLGSLCNDLMWCMFPFFEVNSHGKELYEFAFHHYYDELKNVLQSFNSDLKDFGLPEEFAEFRSLVRRGFVLEFLIVTVLRPVMNINNPEEIMKWYKKLEKYDKMKAKGGVYALLAGKKPKLPPQECVFQNPRYMEFLQFYFKIATALGAFQELGLIYFELMKDGLFKDTTSPIVEKPKVFTKPWFKNMMNISCVKGEKESDTEEDDESDEKEEGKKAENLEVAVEEPVLAINTGDEPKEEVKEENLYEPIAESKKEVKEEVIERKVREPTPPDPLRTLAAQLQRQFVGYKESFNAFENVMDDFKPEPLEVEDEISLTEQKNTPQNTSKIERKLSSEEEIALVKNMSNESAWSHVVSEVMKEKRQASKDESAEVKEKNLAEYSKIERKTSHVEERTLVQTTSIENACTNIVKEVTKENTTSKESISTRTSLESESIPETKSSDQAPVAEDSIERMKRISMDIDISNQKVLETIEFLSSTSSSQDEETTSNITSENEVSNVTEICMKQPDESRKDKSATTRKTGMTEKAFVESLVNDSITDAKHMYAYTMKSESNFEKISKENVMKKEAVNDITIESKVETVKSEEPTGTRNSILAWLSLSSHPKEDGDANEIISHNEEKEEIKQDKDDDFIDQSQQQSVKGNEKILSTDLETDIALDVKKEEGTRSSILNWLNLTKTTAIEDEQEKESQPIIKENTQLERKFSNALDDCKTEVENIQNDMIGLGKEGTTENEFADIKAQILSHENGAVIMDEVCPHGDLNEKPNNVEETAGDLVQSDNTKILATDLEKNIALDVKKEEGNRSSILKWLNLAKTTAIEDEQEKESQPIIKENTPKPQLERTFLNDLDDCKTEVENIQNNIIGLGKEGSTENGFADIKAQLLSEENGAVIMDEVCPHGDLNEKPNNVEETAGNLVQSDNTKILSTDLEADIALDVKKEEGTRSSILKWLNLTKTTAIENEQEKESQPIIKENTPKPQLERTFSNDLDDCKTEVENIQNNIIGLGKEGSTENEFADIKAQLLSDDIGAVIMDEVFPQGDLNEKPNNVEGTSCELAQSDNTKACTTFLVDESGETKSQLVYNLSEEEYNGFEIMKESTMKLTGGNCCHSCACDSQTLLDGKKDDMLDEICQCPHPELPQNDIKDELCQCPHPELSKNLKEAHIGTEESGSVQSKESTMELPEENDCTSCTCEPENTTPIPVKPPRKEKNLENGHIIEESKPVLALTQPTWASIADKPKSSFENEPELPTPNNVIPLKTKRVSTIVIAVDDLKAPATVKEVDEGFRVIRAKRESKMCVEETKCISEEEIKISSSTEENREDILNHEETHKLESFVNNVTIEASQNHGVTTNCASNKEKPESNLESELLTPKDILPLETQKRSNANDDDVVAKYDEQLLILKSKMESKIQYAEDTLSRSFSEQDNETKNKINNSENIVAENETVNTNLLATEYNADMEENSGEIEDQIKKVLQEGADIIEYYQVVENYLDIPILAQKECDTVIESSNFNVVDLKDIESGQVKEEVKPVLPPTSPTKASIEEKPKSHDNEKTTNELEPITLAHIKEQTKQCKDIDSNSEFPVTSYVLPFQSEERDLAIKAPTWASIAEKPKQNCATDQEFLSPSDVIPLQALEVSTIVVSVEDDKAQEVGKEQDNEGFTVVKTKRESKICMETEEEHSKISDVHNEIQTDVHVNDDTVATIRNEEASHEENVNVTDEAVIYVETKANESTDQTADVPILPLAAPTWASIAEKPKQSLEIETELPTPSGIIPLQAHKLSTIVLAVGDDQAHTDDQDDEGFTVVKTKRDSKMIVDNYISKDDQETTPCMETNISLDTIIDNVESIDVEYDNTTDISMSNGPEKESSNVLESLENVLSRKSDSRISMKKRKQKNSIKSNEKLPDLIDSEEVVDLESNRKSREVFDFYVNAIDGDTTMMESQVPAQNGVQNKTFESDQPKSDEQIVIENILNSIPRDMTNGNRFKDNSRKTENENRVLENGKGATEVEDTDLNGMEERDRTNLSSNQTSGASTLKRNWKRQNSKKKRRSSHIL